MFDVPIPTASPSALLRIILPPQFPEQAPGKRCELTIIITPHTAHSSAIPSSALKLHGVAVRHPWVDGSGVIAGHPRLNPWDIQNSLCKSGTCSLNHLTIPGILQAFP
jgi:hypothetical protein